MRTRQPRPILRLAAALVVAIVSFVAAVNAFADFALTDWLYVKALALPGDLGEDGLVELVPDREVFASSSQRLADLRVVASDGSEVPYQLEVSAGQSQRTTLNVKVLDKGDVPGEYTTFVADLGREGILHNQIDIRIGSSNFQRMAVVESSADRETWLTVSERQIYDFTVKERGLTTRDTRIGYPVSTARYLRVRILDDGEGLLNVAGAAVSHFEESPARETDWPLSMISAERDTDRRATLVEMALGSSGIPTNRMELEVPDVNFYREVDLQSSANRQDWLTVSSRAAIYAYDTPKFVGGSLVITYPESVMRYFRLVIFDEDNLPITIHGANASGIQRRLLFSARPGLQYQLYYGNAGARSPSYDIERVLQFLATEGLSQMALGPQQDNPGFVAVVPPPPPTLPLTERLPWLLPASVAAAALVVGLLLYGVLRQARKLLPPPPE